MAVDVLDMLEGLEDLSGIEHEEAKEALEAIRDGDVYDKCVVAASDSHHVVFYKNGDGHLTEVSIKTDWSELNTKPLLSPAGSVENVYDFRDDWNKVYLSDDLPQPIKDIK